MKQYLLTLVLLLLVNPLSADSKGVYGITWTKFDGSARDAFFVDHVIAGSPAEKAGMEPGMYIREIKKTPSSNEISVCDFTLKQWIRVQQFHDSLVFIATGNKEIKVTKTGFTPPKSPSGFYIYDWEKIKQASVDTGKPILVTLTTKDSIDEEKAKLLSMIYNHDQYLAKKFVYMNAIANNKDEEQTARVYEIAADKSLILKYQIPKNELPGWIKASRYF